MESRSAPLRVLYYITYPSRLAGANRSLAELVTNLPTRYEPTVVLAAEGPVADFYRRAGVRCRVISPESVLGEYGLRHARIAPSKILRAALAVTRYTLRLRTFLRDEGFDLVHVNDPRGAIQAGVAAKLAGLPLVQHLRGEFAHGTKLRMVFERLPDRIITVSNGVRATLTAAARERAVTVYNGIRSVPEREEIPWLRALRGAGKVVVACFASVVPFKGQHHLLEAVAALNRAGWRDRAVFLCVGDFVEGYEFYHRWLMRRVPELRLDNVVFTGWQDDPFTFYASADIAVLPSVSHEWLEIDGRTVAVHGSEGFPRTHLEAMSAGLPVVGTRIAGVPEQVAHGETGLLVQPGDPAALAEALRVLLQDEDRRRAMGHAGRERVRRLFSTEAYVRGVTQVYEEVVRGD